MRFSIFQDTRIGGRSNNQDRMGYCYTRDALLMVLADGMGGHLMGEKAAQIALEIIGAAFQSAAKPRIDDPVAFLEGSILEAHHEICRFRIEKNLPETPRTTIVVCIVQNGAAWWAHVGDSRLYLLRGCEILKRTRDHSRMQTLIDQGMATLEDLATHPDRNKLYNCLGAHEPPQVELSGKAQLQPGDALFLCSDGLWSAVSDLRIAATFASHTVMRAVPDLIQMALVEAGSGSDNVTAMAMAWEGGGEALNEAPGVSTDLLPLGALTTTIQQTQPLYPGDAAGSMTDDEIERAINEIRESIRKSNKIVSKP